MVNQNCTKTLQGSKIIRPGLLENFSFALFVLKLMQKALFLFEKVSSIRKIPFEQIWKSFFNTSIQTKGKKGNGGFN